MKTNTPHTTVEGEARTHNTKEVEEFRYYQAPNMPIERVFAQDIDGLTYDLKEVDIHHQLQKAREEAYSEGWKVGFYEGGGQERYGEIPNHFELDQDNK